VTKAIGPSSLYERVDPDGRSCDSEFATTENATGHRPDLEGPAGRSALLLCGYVGVRDRDPIS